MMREGGGQSAAPDRKLCAVLQRFFIMFAGLSLSLSLSVLIDSLKILGFGIFLANERGTGTDGFGSCV